MGERKSETRGEKTRARLLQAAMLAFGREGYDAVSIREIARRANVNVAAINYHFGGKEGLYLEVARQVGERVGGRLGALADRVEVRMSESDNDPAALREIGAELLHGLLDHMLRTGGQPEVLRFILEEQIRPRGGFTIIYESGLGRLHRLFSSLIAGVEGGAADDPDVIIKTHAAIGQCMAFVIAKATLCRRLGLSTLDDATIALIHELIPDRVFGPFCKED